MMPLLKFLLPVYFMVYFGIAFVAKSFIVAKRIGKNPLVLPQDDSVYGLVGRYFKWTLILMFAYSVCYIFSPTVYGFFSLISPLDIVLAKYFGLGCLAFALIWTIIAQNHMKASWRIGIDTETKTELITTGLFGYSRNPIFLGMMISLTGLFLIVPNALTLLFLILGCVLIQIQLRLEEDFLATQHGSNYLQYKQKTRRFL